MARSSGHCKVHRNRAAGPFKPVCLPAAKTGVEEKVMSQNQLGIRGFKATFTIMGSIYALMASSMLVAGVFTALHMFNTWRDLTTSNSRFGNHLYSGPVMVFVYIGLAYTLIFASLVVRGLLQVRARLSAT
jgi:hypothetical protein